MKSSRPQLEDIPPELSMRQESMLEPGWTRAPPGLHPPTPLVDWGRGDSYWATDSAHEDKGPGTPLDGFGRGDFVFTGLGSRQGSDYIANATEFTNTPPSSAAHAPGSAGHLHHKSYAAAAGATHVTAPIPKPQPSYRFDEFEVTSGHSPSSPNTQRFPTQTLYDPRQSMGTTAVGSSMLPPGPEMSDMFTVSDVSNTSGLDLGGLGAGGNGGPGAHDQFNARSAQKKREHDELFRQARLFPPPPPPLMPSDYKQRPQRAALWYHFASKWDVTQKAIPPPPRTPLPEMRLHRQRGESGDVLDDVPYRGEAWLQRSAHWFDFVQTNYYNSNAALQNENKPCRTTVAFVTDLIL